MPADKPKLIFDTDAVRAAVSDDVAFAAWLKGATDDPVSISIITFGEVMQGWLGLINRYQAKGGGDICWAYDQLDEARHDLSVFNVLRYTNQVEAIYRSFPSGVKRIGANDCRIAATAIAHGLIVVTCNTRDFARIPGVRFEDWTVGE